MADKINFIISATDETKAALQSASGGLDGLAKAAGVAMNALIALAAAGLAALGAGLKFAIDEAMEAQDVMAQLNAVLKSTGGAAGITSEMASELADALSQVTKFSDEAALAAETMLLRFENLGEDIFPQALTAAADLATAMGVDLTTAANTVGKALDNPAEGIGRLNTALKLFTQAEMDAIIEMAEMGDLAGAQAIIMERLGEKIGGAALAAGQTAAGQFEIFKNKLANVAEEVGLKLLPVLGRLGEIVFPIILEAVEKLVPLFDQLAKNLGFFMDLAAAGVDPITILGAAFPQMAATIERIGAQLGELGSQIAVFWAAHGTEILDAISFTFGAIAGIVSAALQIVLGIVTAAFALLNGDTEAAGKAMETALAGAWASIVAIFADGSNSTIAAATGLLNQISIIFNAVATNIENAIRNGITAAVNTAKTAVKIGTALIDGITSAIVAGAQGLVDALVGAVLAAVNAAMAAAEPGSPSKLTNRLIGKPLVEGIAAGVMGGAALPAQALVGATLGAVNAARITNNSQSIGIYGPMNLNVQGGQAGAADLLQSLADMGAVA